MSFSAASARACRECGAEHKKGPPWAALLLKYYTYQASAALVDDALHGVAQLVAHGRGHTLYLRFQPLLGYVVERLAEDVRLPDAAHIAVEALQKEAHDLLAGLLPAERGRDLRLYICHHHMYARRAGLQPD